MERSWIYAVVGGAALFVVVLGIKHFSGSDAEEPSVSHPQVAAALPERVRSQGGGWIARPGESDEPGATTSTHGSSSAHGAAVGTGGVHGSEATGSGSSERRGASVFVDSGRGGGVGSGASGGTSFRPGTSGGSGGDALQVGSAVPAAEVPFEGARPITGSLGGRMAQGAPHDTVQQVTDKPVDNSKPAPDDGGPVLSLPFDKTTQPERGDSAVFEQGVTFDSGDGAVFSTDSQFVVPNGGNLKGEAGSLSMWVQPEWAGGDDTNASLAQLRNQNQWEDRLQIFKNGVYLRFLMAGDPGDGSPALESNIGQNISDWAPGDWHHLAATWGQNDAGQLTQSFYVDGRMVGQVPVQGQFNVHPGTPLYIGSDLPQGIPGANGAISQVQAYGRPLDASEIANLAASRPK